MFFEKLWWLMVLATCSGEKWRFPDNISPSFQIDDKARFSEMPISNQNYIPSRGTFQKTVQADDFIFQASADNSYKKSDAENLNEAKTRQTLLYPNQKYPIKEIEEKLIYESDGKADGQESCTCRSKRSCNPRTRSCNTHSKSCCRREDYPAGLNRPEYFNELVDERPMLLPGQTISGGPFPPPPDTVLNGKFGPGHAPEAMVLAALDAPRAHPMPPKIHPPSNGPNLIGNPVQQPKRGVLVGPGGPTGVLGPAGIRHNKNGFNEDNRQVLVGPDGPTGLIGPQRFGQHSKPGLNEDRPGGRPNFEIIVGSYIDQQDLRPSQSAQRPVLVGPGGPTGIIGPQYQRPILVGPGGPTGNFGPRRPILVGPGGPTGIIGPGYGLPTRPGPRRPVLVGPGGPTGVIGPYGVFSK